MESSGWCTAGVSAKTGVNERRSRSATARNLQRDTTYNLRGKTRMFGLFEKKRHRRAGTQHIERETDTARKKTRKKYVSRA
jgi:hypothetical protein